MTALAREPAAGKSDSSKLPAGELKKAKFEVAGASVVYDPWLNGFPYRKSHVINHAAGAGTNYQVQIAVHYVSGTDSAGDVYLNSKCRTDFGDVRFTGSDGKTPLDYWLTSKVDGEKAVFWVKVADDLSSVDRTIYVYYGKSDATTTSLDSREDFTTYTEVDPNSHISKTAYHVDFQDNRNETAYLYKDYGAGNFADFTHLLDIKNAAEAGSRQGQCYVLANDIGEGRWMWTSGKTAMGLYIWDNASNRRLFLFEWYNGAEYDSSNFNAVVDAWYYLKVVKSGASLNCYVYSDSARTNLLATLSLNLQGSWTFRYIYAAQTWNSGNGYQGRMYTDNLFLRKYVSPEPAHSGWGSEDVLVTQAGSAANWSWKVPAVDGTEKVRSGSAANWSWVTFQNDGTGITVPRGSATLSPATSWYWGPQ